MLLIRKSFSFLMAGLAFSGFFLLGSMAQARDCPTVTSISKLPEGASFQKKGPFDPKTITKASATQTQKGLMIFLSNVAINAKDAAPKLPLPPIKEKGNLAIILTFKNNEKPVVGIYEPGTGDQLNLKTSIAFGFAGGGMMSSFTGNQGTAQITELSSAQVCGNFDIQGEGGSVVGKFSAPIIN